MACPTASGPMIRHGLPVPALAMYRDPRELPCRATTGTRMGATAGGQVPEVFQAMFCSGRASGKLHGMPSCCSLSHGLP